MRLRHEFMTHAFDELDHQRASTFEVGAGLFSGELGLLSGYLGMGRDRRELGVHLTRQIGNECPQRFDLGTQLGGGLISENCMVGRPGGRLAAT